MRLKHQGYNNNFKPVERNASWEFDTRMLADLYCTFLRLDSRKPKTRIRKTWRYFGYCYGLKAMAFWFWFCLAVFTQKLIGRALLNIYNPIIFEVTLWCSLFLYSGNTCLLISQEDRSRLVLFEKVLMDLRIRDNRPFLIKRKEKYVLYGTPYWNTFQF